MCVFMHLWKRGTDDERVIPHGGKFLWETFKEAGPSVFDTGQAPVHWGRGADDIATVDVPEPLVPEADACVCVCVCVLGVSLNGGGWVDEFYVIIG